ncbi:MAG: DUF1573 domain-containing protein [bacterium]|nr:DUF1573 domain-containing protein [bacterium]
MKSKTLITSVVFVLVIAGLFIWGAAGRAGTAASVQGAPGAATSGAKSALTSPETFYDFGTISMKNWNVTKEFTVTNPTSEDITIKTVLTSCMCTTAFIVGADSRLKGPFSMPGMGYVPPANETIKPGESRIIRVIYDPNAHGPAGVGQIDRFVTLTDASGGTLQFEIKALVTP